jgi:hypothetical protein
LHGVWREIAPPPPIPISITAALDAVKDQDHNYEECNDGQDYLQEL